MRYVSEHRQVDRLTFPTRRRVRPIGVRNRALPGPTLVWIELEALGIQRRSIDSSPSSVRRGGRELFDLDDRLDLDRHPERQLAGADG